MGTKPSHEHGLVSLKFCEELAHENWSQCITLVTDLAYGLTTISPAKEVQELLLPR